MSSLNLIFTNDFCLEQQYLRDKYVTKLENSIIKYNESLKKGIMFVDDATYTNCVELLGMLNSNSPLLENRKSVKFIKHMDEDVIEYLEEKTKDSEQLEYYLNPQGFNVKLVYNSGELVSATTFGRSFKDEDVLDIVKFILTDRNDNLSDLGEVTIWGTFVLPFENLDYASDICRVENPYQGVFSLIDYARACKKDYDDLMDEYSDIMYEENLPDMVDFESILYFIATDVDLDDFPFESIEQKYAFLDEWEFLTPILDRVKKSGTLSMDIDMIQGMAENAPDTATYMSDGFRLLVLNEKDIILFKTGLWEITYFESIVESIDWVDEKCKKLPLLKLKDTVTLLENNINDSVLSISEILLNNVNLLLMLDIEIGQPVRFAYFGDMGILPITKNNEIILN